MNPHPPLRLPKRPTAAHKGTFGKVLFLGGSRGMCGAISLSAIAALRVGSGLVTAAVPDRCLETVAGFHPCVMTCPMPDDGHGRFSIDAVDELSPNLRNTSAIGCGPGMTVMPGAVRLVERVLETRTIARVLDADALNILAEIEAFRGGVFKPGPLVLTPHPGELERMTGVSSGDRSAQLREAKTLADRSGVVMVVKGGPTSVICRDHSDIWTNETGNPGMATAGSGDVLTGVISSLLGQGLSPWDAARLGVWIHGLAGDLATIRFSQAGIVATDIVDLLPEAIGRAVSP